MRTRIRARFVIGFIAGDRAIYERGEVVFEADTIVFVGLGFPGNVDVDLDATS